MYLRILLGFVLVAVLGGLAVAGFFGLPVVADLPGMADLPGIPMVPAGDTLGATSIFPTPTPAPIRGETISLNLPTPTPAPEEVLRAEPVQSPEVPVATVPGTTVANADANLRVGPGTTYDRIGSVVAGAPLAIVARTAAGNWYQLESGAWIAAFLVDGEPGEVPVVVELPAVK